MRMLKRNLKRLSAEVFSSAQKQPKQNASSQNREENGSTTLRNTREKPLLAGYLRDSRASERRARVKITPREKRRHAAGREKNEGLQTKPKLLTLHFSLSPPRVAFSCVG